VNAFGPFLSGHLCMGVGDAMVALNSSSLLSGNGEKGDIIASWCRVAVLSKRFVSSTENPGPLHCLRNFCCGSVSAGATVVFVTFRKGFCVDVFSIALCHSGVC
jgi:hypothetical protein